MRYRLATSHKEKHAQVLTPPHLARCLVQALDGTGKTWLELGAGTGRIADACLTYRKPASYTGIEIDADLLALCPRSRLSQYVHADVLDPQALERRLGAEMFDRVGGNPPYGMAALPDAAIARLDALCPGLPLQKVWGQLDLYFVLESLARLKRPGEAAFVVGAALAEDVRLEAFRRHLVAAASEIECYELPRDVFANDVEVQSYLLIARFGRRRECRVRVGRMQGKDLVVAERREITAAAAAERLDLSYHKFLDLDQSLRQKRGCVSLGELGAEIVRGSRSRNEFLSLDISHFHTSDFPRGGLDVRFGDFNDRRFQLAKQGDILLPRVGSRCLDRQAIVKDGSSPYTESVFRVRLPRAHQERVLKWISTDAGAFWRRAAAKGTCAKHLTVSALLGMPVPAQR